MKNSVNSPLNYTTKSVLYKYTDLNVSTVILFITKTSMFVVAAKNFILLEISFFAYRRRIPGREPSEHAQRKAKIELGFSTRMIMVPPIVALDTRNAYANIIAQHSF